MTVDVSVGQQVTCSISDTGSLCCYDMKNEVYLSVPSEFLESTQQVSVGRYHICAIGKARMLKCWMLSGKVREVPSILATGTVAVGAG